MPIAPENRHRYPANWRSEIRPRIMERAGQRCECDGRCGRGHRGRCPEHHLHPAVLGPAGTTVFLTVAHLDHDLIDHSDENLAAMCQGCHLAYDEPQHRQSRIERTLRALEHAGQLQIDGASC